ncbi:hypothetical protein [Bifidobacterium mongoliense]|uniref:DUF333 domain-containing protein n=1 Tax=Bifidobacterium mongoliense DSM 21395 TaxID=1437603 RepID=A0A087BZV8_9BIFI|nr:hypothetical protein [Bifidobacterium mongoliense]KFI76558.1 hypothetical protein BMON_1154 [Bifidobacterium mongoliense DSM 21395]
MKGRSALIAVVVMMAMLSGCGGVAGSQERQEQDTQVSFVTLKRPDDGKVLCAVYSNGQQGGLSCDWDDAQ